MTCRLFIDCSFVDFTAQPTGIPRVVLQYIEAGYRWSERTGVDVIPVVTTAAGLLPVRPMPGARHPRYLDRFEEVALEPAAAVPLLDRATFYLQSALVEANVRSMAAQSEAAIRHCFQSLVSDAHLHPIEPVPGDILFCPAYWHDLDPKYLRSVQLRGARIVTLVHDILPVTHPRFYKAPWKHLFAANLITAMRRSDALFAVSQATADAMIELAARSGLADVTVGVARNGYHPLVSQDMRRRVDTGAFTPVLREPTRYAMIREMQPFLMVGSIEPKKGHIPVIRSFEALWDAGLARPLVIVGRKGWLEESVVHAIRTSRHYKRTLFWFEDFDDLDLYSTYRRSRGLIFGSYAEGFGIPMIEALAAGCPVIGYDTPINREVLGSHGLMFDDFASFGRHVIALDDDDTFAAACARVADFSWPSWDDVTSALFDSLREIFADELP